MLVLVGQGNAVLGLLGLVLGAVVPWLYLGIRRSRRRAAFLMRLQPELRDLADQQLALFGKPARG